MARPRRLQGTYAGIGNLGDWFRPEPGVGVARVVAIETGDGGWEAFAENALTFVKGNSYDVIAECGTKLTAHEATAIFSEWADRLPYRD